MSGRKGMFPFNVVTNTISFQLLDVSSTVEGGEWEIEVKWKKGREEARAVVEELVGSIKDGIGLFVQR